MNKVYGFGGLILFFFGLLSAYFQSHSLVYSYSALCIGLFLFFDSIEFYLKDNSLIHDTAGYESPLTAILLGGVFIGFVIEFYGVITGMWGGLYYSEIGAGIASLIADYYIDMTVSYGFLILPGFSIYRVLDHELEGLTDMDDGEGVELRKDRIYILVAGVLMLLAPLTVLIQDFRGPTRFAMFAVSLLGLWFVIEYFEFKRHRRGLMSDVLDLRFDRLAALSLTSMIIGFLIELINIYNQAWSYTEAIPFIEYRLIGVPPIIVLGWIPLLSICLSFFNIFRDEQVLF